MENTQSNELEGFYSSPTQQVEAPKVKIEYASFWTRVGASFIDGIVMSVILATSIGGLAVTTSLGDYFTGGALASFQFLSASIAYVLGSAVVTALYQVGLESSNMQATLGKRACGLKVMKTDGSKITMTDSLKRGGLKHGVSLGISLLQMVAPFAGLLALGHVIAIIATVVSSDKKQCYHDKIADTVVVKA